MKIHHPALLVFILALASCRTVSYTGDTFTPSAKVDVYYTSEDVDHQYRIVGCVITRARGRDNKAKERIIAKAKSVGADGVIISAISFTEETIASAYEKQIWV